MNRATAVTIGAAVFLAVAVVGINGYMLIEDMSFLDATYFTVITLFTVGYSEPGGGFSTQGELFTIAVLILGVGAALYTATSGIEYALFRFLGGDRQKRRMQREIDKVTDHIVVCGFGIVGRGVWERLSADAPDVDLVVIEHDPELVQDAIEHGALTVEGDATHDEILIAAGIDRSRAVVACVASDSDNLVIVLSAKARRPGLLVLSRATEAESQRKLALAGADRVVAPQVVGAQRLASLAIQPEVAEFIDLIVQGRLLEFRVEQLVIAPQSVVVGKTLRETAIRRDTGTMVIAVQQTDGGTAVNPGADFRLEAGQTLFGVGTQDQVQQLRILLTDPA